MLGHVKLR